MKIIVWFVGSPYVMTSGSTIEHFGVAPVGEKWRFIHMCVIGV